MRGLWICAVVSLFTSQPLRVVVNLPAFRVDACVGDSLIRSSAIAIGMRGFRTPRGEFAITSVDWNPWWIPPDRAWAKREKPTPPGPANPMGRVFVYRDVYNLATRSLRAELFDMLARRGLDTTRVDSLVCAN